MAESTRSSCQDGLDNDDDRFVDCADYQCLNNPITSNLCKPVVENTIEACSDGIDNDYLIDCQDPNCGFNPFFGDLICRHKAQTF